jgi:hypothetical protein
MKTLLFFSAVLLSTCSRSFSSRNLGSSNGKSNEQNQMGEMVFQVNSKMPLAGANAFSVLAANVGNVDVFRCESAIYKLCDADQEQRVANNMARLKPDIALLSETMNESQCESLQRVPDWHVCHSSRRAQSKSQARRILGDDYTIACEPRRGYECIGVRKEFAQVQGCKSGDLCLGLLKSAAAVDGCDDGFTLSSVMIELDGSTLELAVAHPQSGFSEKDKKCRADFLSPLFQVPSIVRSQKRILVGGDFNLDAFRFKGPDSDLFNQFVQVDFGDKPLTYHSGFTEKNPPYWSSPLSRVTMDHVFSSDLIGRCVTLGAAKDNPALDAPSGADDLQKLDHLAQYCVLSAVDQ